MEVEELFLDEDTTILHAMQQMDYVGKKVLFVTENGRLLATLTDGDIRRWILKNGELEAAVSNAANYAPVYLNETENINIGEFMRKRSLEAIPIVNDEEKIVSIQFWDEKSFGRKKKKLEVPVVMMAGGKGTRLYPYTKILPKPLIPVGEYPIAEVIMDYFNKFGCQDFYIIVNHKKNMIKAYFGEVHKKYTINFVDEDKPLGTGGGLFLLKGKIHSTFILTNCDILIEEDFAKIVKQHHKEQNMITMICSLRNYTVPYGVVEIGEHGCIKDMKEKPEISFFTNTGSYIVEPEVIDAMSEDEEIGFPDVIQRWKDKGYKVGVYPVGENAWMDMGQMDELSKMDSRMRKEKK